jgi:hypothetical protein
MDNGSQTPSFEIPKSPEKMQSSHEIGEGNFDIETSVSHEILPPPAPKGSLPISAPLAVVVAQTPVARLPLSPTQQIATDDSHIIADDVDVIEKEWVSRAKKIATMTSNDPFIETQEIGKLKAAYMKKRFNKDVIVSAEQVK